MDGVPDVLVTGLGTVSCLGTGLDACWRGLNAATTTPSRVPDPLAHMDHPLMYLVPEADLPAGPAEQDGLPLGRASRLGLVAAAEAVTDAGLPVPGAAEARADETRGALAARTVDPSRVAVAISSGMGDALLHEEWRSDERPAGHRGGDRWVPPFPVASVVGGWFGARGANTCISNACAASGYALSVAADLIRVGEADVVIAGGAEAYSRVALACFNRLGAIDAERCRPFSADRHGTIFGEGAAVLVLESAEHARARGARRAYARLAGAGWSCDAHHATAPEPSGTQIERAMRRALAESGVGDGELGLVVPHGTGTDLNDVVESRVLRQVLGEAAGRTPLYSAKALLGHTGGAAGAFAALAGVLALHHRTIPPNVPVGDLDEECPVLLPERSTPVRAPYALINAYAFGGNNVSLVFRQTPRDGLPDGAADGRGERVGAVDPALVEVAS